MQLPIEGKGIIMALDGDKPYIRLQVTPEIMEMLDRWKELSGSNYSMTVRLALLEYLADKLKDAPHTRARGEQQNVNVEDERAQLAEYYTRFVLDQRSIFGGNMGGFRSALNQDMTKRKLKLIRTSGLGPGEYDFKEMAGIVAELVKGDSDAHSYMAEAIEPRTRSRLLRRS